MKITDIEIKNVAEKLSNYIYSMNFQATRELMRLFDAISKIPLNTVEEYVKMYDDNFYTYKTWEELIKSEEEQPDGLTEEECKEQLGKSIWQLPCGWYVQYV